MANFVRLTGLFVSEVGKRLGISSSTNRLDRETDNFGQSSGHGRNNRPSAIPQKDEDGVNEGNCRISPVKFDSTIAISQQVSSRSNEEKVVFRFGDFAAGQSGPPVGSLRSITEDTKPSEIQPEYECVPRSLNALNQVAHSANKKTRVDRYLGGGMKRRVSSTDLNCDPSMYGSSTSDYWSNEVIPNLISSPNQLLRPESAPDISRHRNGITFKYEMKNTVFGSGNTVVHSKTSDSNLGVNEKSELAATVRERTNRILKCQTLDGVQTEAYEELKKLTNQTPKFTILYGEGSNFNACKFLKDSQDGFSRSVKSPKVLILENPKEWRVIEEGDETIIVLKNVTGDECFEEKKSFKWKARIKNEILPLLKQNNSLTVIVTEKAFPERFFWGSSFQSERELRQFIVETQKNKIGEIVRRRLIWHELDRHDITTTEKRYRCHTDHRNCIKESEITYIATKTTNLFFPQRISEYFSRFSEESIESFNRPDFRYIEIMKYLEPKDVLAMLALVAFGGTILKADIEKFRTKDYTLGKNFRRSMADINQTDIRASAIRALTQFASQHSLTIAMWDTIESGLMKMAGTFVIDQKNAYKFDGVAVEYSFLLSLTLPLDSIISFCDTWFLHNLIAPMALQNEFDDCVAFIGEGQTKAVNALYKRLVDEIKQRNVKLAWTHKMMAERWFCEGFLKYIKKEEGGLSRCLLMTDRRDAYNVLHFGLEKQFRIHIEGDAENITELVFQHPSYKKWRERHDTYKYLKDGHEEAALRHAVELERESSVAMFLKLGVQAKGDILSVAVETQNIEMLSMVLRSQKLQKDPICFESRCTALKRSLELYSKTDADTKSRQIFETLSFSASINYSSGNFEPLIIMATKKRDMTMLELLMTYHMVESDINRATENPVMQYEKTDNDERNAFEGRSFEKLDVNITTKTGDTALNIAISRGFYEIITYLLQNGVNQRSVLRKGEPPVIVAVRRDDKHALKLLMANDEDIVNAQDRHGKSVLHHAVESEKLACLEVLLASNCLQINVVDRQNETVLHKAVAYEKGQLVSLLLRAGADIELTDLDDNTALNIAFKMKHVYCLELLFKAARERRVCLNDEILFGILRTNNQRLWAMVFKYGFDINYQTREGVTPLFMAVHMRNSALVRFLLKHGADPNCDLHRFHYLDASCKPKDRDILKMLVEFGANIGSSKNTLV